MHALHNHLYKKTVPNPDSSDTVLLFMPQTVSPHLFTHAVMDLKAAPGHRPTASLHWPAAWDNHLPDCFLQESQSMASAFFCCAQHYHPLRSHWVSAASSIEDEQTPGRPWSCRPRPLGVDHLLWLHSACQCGTALWSQVLWLVSKKQGTQLFWWDQCFIAGLCQWLWHLTLEYYLMWQRTHKMFYVNKCAQVPNLLDMSFGHYNVCLLAP